MFPFLSCASVDSYVNITSSTQPSSIDLTALGGSDYHKLLNGTAPPDGYRKSGGGSLISVTRVSPSGWTTFNENKPSTFSISDSIPTFDIGDSQSVETHVDWDGSVDEGGYQITVPAGLTERTCKLYMGIYSGGSSKTFRCSASISGESTSDAVYEVSTLGSGTFFLFDIVYKATNPSQTLTIYMGTDGDSSGSSVAVFYAATWLS